MPNISTTNPSQFIIEQLNKWPLAAKNYNDLQDVKVRELLIGSNLFKLQLNPHRVVSSGAKVDVKSIQERPCFLCHQNRPKEQIEINLENEMTFLVNPFPIFKEHFTIPSDSHTLQEITPHLEKGLQMALELPKLVFFYNGAKCGASAPDHFHYQAGNRGFLPLEIKISSEKNVGNLLFDTSQNTKCNAVKDGIRNYLIFTGENLVELSEIISKIIQIHQDKSTEEPRLNLLFWSDNRKITVVYLPRETHRPNQYTAEGVDNIMFSPAAVEMGGVCIFARQEDYNKMTEALLQDMLKQVTFPDSKFDNLCLQIQNNFTA